MPYKLRKAPKRNLYWVVNKDTGKKHSKDPLPKAKAQAQMKALYAAESRYKMKGGYSEEAEQAPAAHIPPPHYFTLVRETLEDLLNRFTTFESTTIGDVADRLTTILGLLREYTWVLPEDAFSRASVSTSDIATDARTGQRGVVFNAVLALRDNSQRFLDNPNSEATLDRFRQIIRLLLHALAFYPERHRGSGKLKGRGGEEGKEPPKPPTEAEREPHRPQGPQVPMGRIENHQPNFIQDLILLMREHSRDNPVLREIKERVRMYFQLVIDLLREFRQMVNGFAGSSEQERILILQTFQQTMAFFRKLLPQYQWVVPETAIDADDREYLERADDAATHREGYLMDPLGELEEAVGMLMRFSDVEDATEDILRTIDKLLQAYPLQTLASNNQGRWWNAMGAVGQGKMKGKGKEKLPEWSSALPGKWKKFLGYG